jgi:hypothetical protein
VTKCGVERCPESRPSILRRVAAPASAQQPSDTGTGPSKPCAVLAITDLCFATPHQFFRPVHRSVPRPVRRPTTAARSFAWRRPDCCRGGATRSLVGQRSSMPATCCQRTRAIPRQSRPGGRDSWLSTSIEPNILPCSSWDQTALERLFADGPDHARHLCASRSAFLGPHMIDQPDRPMPAGGPSSSFAALAIVQGVTRRREFRESLQLPRFPTCRPTSTAAGPCFATLTEAI